VPRVATTKLGHPCDTLASKLLNAMRVIVR
jgi:hypothetical protein